MKVRQIMSRNVVIIEPTLSISKAAQKMRELDIGFLPICENDRLIGTITDRDITIRSVAQGLDPRLIHVREIMTQMVFYCYDDEDVGHVGEVMQEQEVRRMLILNRQKRLVGVVSLGDIAKTSGETQLAGETLGEIAEAA
jgi:CBS domain-containing protein